MWYVRGCGEEGVVDEVVVCKRSVVKLKTNESGDVYRGNACSVWGGMFRNRKKKSYFQRNSCVCVVLFCFVLFFSAWSSVVRFPSLSDVVIPAASSASTPMTITLGRTLRG